MNLSEEPKPLSRFIEFQEGAVVSRTLLQKNTGTVTLFAFDTGESLSEHTSPFDALVELIEGKMLITISGRKHHVEAGEMLMLPADKPHALLAEVPSKMMLIMIRE